MKTQIKMKSSLKFSISVIVPCYNEEKNIIKVIEGIKKNLKSDFEIIVVDNNSEDATFKKAKASGVIVIKEKIRGKGRAMISGAKRARGDILVFIDGDNSYSPKFILRVLNPILGDESDIVYGSRFLKNSKVKISKFRFLGNKFFSFLGSFYQKNTDFLTGFFAIKKKIFFELNLNSKGFEIETEIFKKAVNKKLKIKEVPIEYKSNKNSKLNPLVDGFKILKTLIFTKIK